MNKRWFFIFIFLSSLGPSLVQGEEYLLEPIVITSARSAYPRQILSCGDLEDSGIKTISDILEYAQGLDLRYRGEFGVQGDLSLRGSTYEQAAVLIDGIRINDPQTGHHNLDIPLTVFDVERVEVFREGFSSRFGNGAFAGAVNVVTKKPVRRESKAELLFGEHALFGQGFSFNIPGDDWAARLSVEHKSSNGSRANTDFEYGTASLYLKKDYDAASFDALFGWQEKDFGASSFYSNLFPEEEEHTKTLFFKGGLEANFLLGQPRVNIFLRKHRDKFILERNNPVFVNYHTTYVYGLNSQADLPFQYGNFLAGFDVNEEEINSSRLGKHSRLDLAPSFTFAPDLGDRITAEMGVRFDRYINLSWQESYNAAIGYDINDFLKLRGSLGRAFRIPSFTELYYSDPGNIGNPRLKVEQSDNFGLGLAFKNEVIDAGLDGFYRKGRNMIDWRRESVSQPWLATNLGRAEFKGAEFKLKYKRLEFSYTYIDVDKESGGFLSKYALDVLQHQYAMLLDCGAKGINANFSLSYNERYYGENYFLVDFYLSRIINLKGFSLEPFLKIDNLADAEYSEVGGVLQPGRWIQAGLRFNW